MSAKIGKKGRNPGAVDHWLDNLGLYRKNVAYDETCLFRAISEQLFNCQVYHERVRRECISFARENWEEFSDISGSKDKFLEHIDNLEKHMVVCGDIELKIISKKYNHSIIIFDAAEQRIFHFTNQELPDVFLLCLLDRDHFDVVYKKEHINSAGFCQSIVYKVLYEDVFKIPNVDEIVHNMLYDKGNIITQAELMMEKKRMLLESGNEDLIEENLEEKLEENNAISIAPFPFKIAKALDPNIYRNIEYDSWGEMRREWRLGEWYYGDNKLILGTKCIYTDTKQEKYDCYIQEIIKEENKCVVYLTRLAEKRTVKYSDLSPEDDAKAWPLPYRFTKSVVITPTTPPAEKNAIKPRKRGNKDKKRTKSESSVLSATNIVKHDPLVDNVDAYIGVPLQMQNVNSTISNPVNSNSIYCQTEASAETQTDPILVQESIPTVLVENESADESRWYASSYQWQPFVTQTVDPFIWPTGNQNVLSYSMKPMVASAPATPSVIPYHDPTLPSYYYNYHVDNYPYQTYPQWSSPAFELQPPPPPRNQERVPEQEQTASNGNKLNQLDESEKIKTEATASSEAENIHSPVTPAMGFLEASDTPHALRCMPGGIYSPSGGIYSPTSSAPGLQVPQLTPGYMYASATPDMRELVLPTAPPMLYSPSVEVPYMPTSPYIYPPTPPPTNWYSPGITPQGFIFPPGPMQ